MNRAPPFVATYRLQLNANFTFGDAANIVDYLSELGVSHLYLSPIFASKSKSTHGYDITNPTSLSQERGGERAFDQLMKIVSMQKPAMGAIVDIVPNHMSASHENPFFADLLRAGTYSQYFDFFDVYGPNRKQSPLLILPFLGSKLGAALSAGEVTLVFDPKLGFLARYYENSFPLAYRSIPVILYKFIDALVSSPYVAKNELTELSNYAHALERELIKKSPSFSEPVEKIYQWVLNSALRVNQLKDFLKSAPLLFVSDILRQQHFALDFWKTASANYRRFFDINSLIALKMEDPFVFDILHKRLASLFSKYAALQGIRVDHVDGLASPELYLESVSKITPFVWVEKILSHRELLSTSWKTCGTTGYDFLNALSHVFIDEKAFKSLHAFHDGINPNFRNYEGCERSSRQQIIDESFHADFTRLSETLRKLLLLQKKAISSEEAFLLVREFAVALPIYRFYPTDKGLTQIDQEILTRTLGRVRRRLPAKLKPIVDQLAHPDRAILQWLKRLQQFTGAGFAKGVEDTAFYRYYPLLALNEVGGNPILTLEAKSCFHELLSNRAAHTPLSLNATSTHDTKRSEDARARLMAISHHVSEWKRQVKRWQKSNAEYKTIIKRKLFPDAATEYFIYQTLISIWPLEGQVTTTFFERIKNYLVKATREAKQYTSWRDPSLAYESAVLTFIDKLQNNEMCLNQIQEFVNQISLDAAFISLASVAVKILAPGVPDFYQGSELWDFSLVDPDNRRPIDYEERRHLLGETKRNADNSRAELLEWLQKTWKSGAIKQWLISELLHLRRNHHELFRKGEYLALKIDGKRNSDFFAFARHHANKWAIVVIPTGLEPIEDRYLILPRSAPNQFWNHLEQKPIKGSENKLKLHSYLGRMPLILSSF